jgi:hypothetical protein
MVRRQWPPEVELRRRFGARDVGQYCIHVTFAWSP